MGNEVSREQTKMSKGEKETIKKVVMQDRITNIDGLQEDMIESIKNGRITTREELVKSVFYTETAKEQIKKGGASLTKVDLIAIILLIDSTKIHTIDNLKSLTVSDLNSIIRSIIYDTNTYNKPQNTERITNNSTSSLKQKSEKSLKIENELIPTPPDKPKRGRPLALPPSTTPQNPNTSSELVIHKK